MKVVILAGGFGTRLSEETEIRPKPMVEIGGQPIIWHIMKYFGCYGHRDFVVCLGYRGDKIKEYFVKYHLSSSDFTIDTASGGIEISRSQSDSWRVTLVETGLSTQTGGRLKRVKSYVDGDPFMMTYGDGLSDVQLDRLIAQHQRHGKLATVTAVQPRGRFGALSIAQDSRVESFTEKPKGDGSWINGGFFVLQPGVFDFIDGDQVAWEHEPMMRLVAKNQLSAFKHSGFWAAMDTLSDKRALESIWAGGKAPWKRWDG